MFVGIDPASFPEHELRKCQLVRADPWKLYGPKNAAQQTYGQARRFV